MVYAPYPLLVNQGGTGLNAVPFGSLVYGGFSNSLITLPIGSAGQLIIGGISTPSWSSITSNSVLSPTGNTVVFTPGAGTLNMEVGKTLIATQTVTLTSAQIKLLSTTPVVLVTPQGIGTTIQFLGAQLKLKCPNGVNFTGPQNLAIVYTGVSGVVVSSSITGSGFIDQPTNTYTSCIPIANAIVTATGAEDQGLYLFNTSGTQITGGADGANTLVVTISYRVLTQ